jgi:hypothetical protein
MPAEVHIQTGDRNVWSYVLKPCRARFTERSGNRSSFDCIHLIGCKMPGTALVLTPNRRHHETSYCCASEAESWSAKRAAATGRVRPLSWPT